MALVYSDTEERQPGIRLNLDRINPNKPYARHAAAWFYLRFMLARGTTLEKKQASRELLICERKMAFWYRHPAFSIEEAGKAIKEQQKLWQTEVSPVPQR